MNALPELNDPELFFRVTKTSVQLHRRIPDTEWNEEVPPNIFINTKDYHYDDSPQGTIETRTIQVLSTPKLFQRTRIIKKTEYRWINRSVILSAEWAEYEEVIILGNKVTRSREINREDIPVLAERALKRYNDDLERQNLLGDYPPKKLEAEG